MKKVVLVTGSSKGIGASCIKKFAQNGYDVVITYKDDLDSAKQVEEETNKYGVKSLLVQCDLASEKDINRLIDSVISTYGTIDVLVNNVGIEESSDFFDKSKESFDRIFSVNVTGTFLLTKRVVEIMMKKKSGKIINISSNNSTVAGDINTLEYDMSKASINVFTKDLAKYLAPHINVNAVLPGWVLTEKVDKLNKSLDGKLVEEESKNILLGRFASPEEIANVVYFFASDEAKYINGELITIDGGYKI